MRRWRLRLLRLLLRRPAIRSTCPNTGTTPTTTISTRPRLSAEIYIDLSDTLKFTGGIRTTGIRKACATAGTSSTPSSRSRTACSRRAFRQSFRSARRQFASLDPDPFTQDTPGAVNDFRVIESDFNSTTGRAVLQWTPSDNVQYYASWTSRLQNRRLQSALDRASRPAGNVRPEVINAFEAGVKSNLRRRQTASEPDRLLL
ncbi:MAG: TonB-dependent receptor [Parvularculaceae bacterium]